MPDQRLNYLEEKLAHQEHSISELNEALYLQQQRIEMLELRCAHLSERVRNLQEGGPGSGEVGDEAPPHY
jgi:SlyX protein